MKRLLIKGLKKTGILFCSLLTVLLISCQDKEQAKPLPKPVVPAIKISIRNIPISKEYIGISQSIASIAIRARVKGFLTKINFIEGKPVEKDQLLFVIDPRPFEAKLELAQGKLAQTTANRDYQSIQYKRMKELVVKGDVSKSHYDDVAAQYAEAVADVKVSQAQVEEAKINLGYCYMYSPVDGIIGHKYVDVGNLVGGGENTLLATVVKLDPIYIEFSPSIEDFSELVKYRANMPFKVEVSFPQNKSLVFKGKVDLVNNQANVDTSTILMRATVDNPEQLILPGIYMNLKMTLTNHGQAILVPSTAILESQGKRTVYVVGKDNKVINKTIVTAGQYGQSDYIVKSGLSVGDIVISNGMQKIRPGEEVTVNLTDKQG